MDKNQQQKLIEMKRDLEIIGLERISTPLYGSDEIKINEENYRITNKISECEIDEYLKILNAHNIQKIKSYVKFFFILTVISLIPLAIYLYFVIYGILQNMLH